MVLPFLLLASVVVLTACAKPYVQVPGQDFTNPQLTLGPAANRGFVRVSDGARLPVQVWPLQLERLHEPWSSGCMVSTTI